MEAHLFKDNEQLLNIYNSIPFPLMVVDEDMRILFWNSASQYLLNSEVIYRQRGGEILYCIHSKEAEEGCGYAPYCKTCVIRNSVMESIHGNKAYRKKTIMELITNEGVKQFPLLVTTTPYHYKGKFLALLILEDLQELLNIGSLLPICARCKKIRTEKNQWQSIENYIKENIVDVNFTHGICPDCMKSFFPNNVPES